MNRRSGRLLALVAGTLALSGCLLFAVGDGYLKFSGTVRDTNGVPVENARVEVLDTKTNRRISVRTTDVAGHFSIADVVCPCDFPLRITGSKAGFGETAIDTRKSKIGIGATIDLTLSEHTP